MTDYGYELEAIEAERFDADLEMAQFAAQARESANRRRRGICDHNSRLGGGVDYYSADDIAGMLARGHFPNRGGFDGAQTDIPAGKDLCTDCGELVAEWVIR